MDTSMKSIYEKLILALGHLGQADGQSYLESRKEIEMARDCVALALEELVALMDSNDTSIEPPNGQP